MVAYTVPFPGVFSSLVDTHKRRYSIEDKLFILNLDKIHSYAYNVCWQTKLEVKLLHTAFGLKIKHLNNLITKKIYALFTNDEYPFISHSSFLVIDYLYENQNHEVTQKDIEKALVINRATTSKMLLLLEQKGFISRMNSTEDARRKIVVLTERGHNFRTHNLMKAEELNQFFSEVLSEEDLIAFNQIYEKLRNALEE